MKQIAIKIEDEHIYDAAKRLAKAEDRSVANWARRLVIAEVLRAEGPELPGADTPKTPLSFED